MSRRDIDSLAIVKNVHPRKIGVGKPDERLVLDIKLIEMQVWPDVVAHLLGVPEAHAISALWDTDDEDHNARFPGLLHMESWSTLQNMEVVIAAGVRLQGCDVKKFRIRPVAGGVAEMDCVVSTEAGDSQIFSVLAEYLGEQIRVTMEEECKF